MDEKQFRRILRSALALSLTTPAVFVACNGAIVTPASIDGADASDDAAASVATGSLDTGTNVTPTEVAIDAGKPAIDCDKLSQVRRPTGPWWDGGDYEGNHFDAGFYEGGTSRKPVCGCATLNAPTCTRREVQFPCDSVAPSLYASPTYEQCLEHCVPNADQVVSGCRTRLEYPGNVTPPVLVCHFQQKTPNSAACGCANIEEQEATGCNNGSRQLPCEDYGTFGTLPSGSRLDAGVCQTRNPADAWNRSCSVERDDAGVPFLNYYGGGCPGRKPEGLTTIEQPCGSPTGQWLAEAAYFEAASITSFEILGAELERFNAPNDLVCRARDAREDEVKHARMMRKLARRRGVMEGAWAEEPHVERTASRSLEAIALENAVEGCVHETYAALLALWQGERAVDPAIRTAMRSIAEDEIKHARLAWSVAAWLEPQLDDAARERVIAARTAAKTRLVDTLAVSTDSSELLEGGILPTKAEARMLTTALDTLLAQT